jgi:hypothetical protein
MDWGSAGLAFCFSKINRPRRIGVNMLQYLFPHEGGVYNKEATIAAFEAHNADVISRVSPENLLIYDVKQGWGPLCEFLGEPVPEEPFPRLNDKASFNRFLDYFRMAVNAGAALTVLGLAYLPLSAAMF